MLETITTGIFFTNTYVLSNNKNECIIIDPTLSLKDYAEDINTKYNVKGILLTHGHVDHIDGIRYFNCPIYCYSLEKVLIENDDYNLYQMLGKKSFLPNNLDFRYVNDGDIINLIGLDIKVIYTPGHTNGSCCYLIGDKLFSGDTMFYHSVGRSDFPTGNEKKLRDSIKKLLELNNNIKVYPGHDSKTTIREESKFNPYR